MAPLVRTEMHGDVAAVLVDNPPVNALSPGVPEELEEAILRAAALPEVCAVILAGAGSTFIAGADIRKFETLTSREQCLENGRRYHDLLVRIEDIHKPLIAAIHGTALGGGLEFAMACHCRIALSNAKVGQPEVSLGIIPGAGGTQRLPRLCGVATALELCTQGYPISAKRALSEGILDRVVTGDLLTSAIAFAREVAGQPIRRTRDRTERLADAAPAIEAARTSLKKASRGATAPLACVDAIEATVTLGFDEGSKREIEIFADCVLSAESRAMVRLFFAEREVSKVPGVPKDTPTLDITRVGVIGAGTMGGGIAMAFLNAGIPVRLKETSREALDRGLAVIRKNYASTVSKGRLSAEDMERRLSLLCPSLTSDGFDSVDLVIEAAFENLAVKTAIFEELGRITRADCLLASNTSTFDIDVMAAASGRPENVLGLHFFSPANVMRLIEIVRGKQTSPTALATAINLAKRLSKIGVVVGNCFGFVANRMIAYYLREAGLLLEEGASVSQIDRVVAGFGVPVGPFAMQDIAGIDVGARIHEHLRETTGKGFAEGPEPLVAERLFRLGRYGQKTGAGFYRYEPGSRTPIPDPAVEEIAIEAAKKRGISRREIPDCEIHDRILFALINEGARVLQDGIAARPGDIDVIYCHGFGFPRHRGGPMFYAESLGVDKVVARLEEFESRLGPHWHPYLKR